MSGHTQHVPNTPNRACPLSSPSVHYRQSLLLSLFWRITISTPHWTQLHNSIFMNVTMVTHSQQQHRAQALVDEIRILCEELEQVLDLEGNTNTRPIPQSNRRTANRSSYSHTDAAPQPAANNAAHDLRGQYVRITTRPYYNLRGTVSRKRGSKFWWIRLDDGSGREIYKKTEHIQILQQHQHDEP